jgi:TetR/AcrR family transcriptional regulator, transcriptional repressor for nem operon
MPRGTTTKKQETHERIVRTAAAAIRRSGYAGASVADVMDEAGLTHGGFYAHFPSRDAMVVEALDQAFAQTIDRLGKVSDSAPAGNALDTLMDSYLSDRHVEAIDNGCSIAALGSETPRQAPEVRRVMTRRVKEMADLVARQLPSWGDASSHDDALAVLSTMVGALLIARAVDDPALAKSVRASAKRLVDRGTHAPSGASKKARK